MRKKQKTEINHTFIKRLTALKEKRGLVNRQIGVAVDVTEGAVSSWLVGRRFPEEDTLQELANFFNVSIDFLLGNSDITDRAEDMSEGIEIKTENVARRIGV